MQLEKFLDQKPEYHLEWPYTIAVEYTVERLGGPLRSKMLAPEAILHKIKHVTVMRLLIVGGARPLLL